MLTLLSKIRKKSRGGRGFYIKKVFFLLKLMGRGFIGSMKNY